MKRDWDAFLEKNKRIKMNDPLEFDSEKIFKLEAVLGNCQRRIKELEKNLAVTEMDRRSEEKWANQYHKEKVEIERKLADAHAHYQERKAGWSKYTKELEEKGAEMEKKIVEAERKYTEDITHMDKKLAIAELEIKRLREKYE